MQAPEQHNAIDRRIAQRLRELRAQRGWALDELAQRSSISRATLSRLENGDVSPTASVLGKLCGAYGMTMSRLMRMVEEEFAPLVPRHDQPVWVDQSSGFTRRSVSPPAQTLAGEALECELAANAHIGYDSTPRPGLEHHLILVDGRLEVRIDGARHLLQPGDCLRYQLNGPSSFSTPPDSGARYFLFIL